MINDGFLLFFYFDNVKTVRDQRPRVALQVGNSPTSARCGSSVGVYTLAGAAYYDNGSALKYHYLTILTIAFKFANLGACIKFLEKSILMSTIFNSILL